MERREMKKWERSLDGGRPEDRLRLLQSARDRADHSLMRLREKKDARRAMHHESREAWRGEPDAIAVARPVALTTETRDARKYRWGGRFCLLLEVLVVVGILWMFPMVMLGSVLGSVFAGVIAGVMIYFLTVNRKNPKEPLRHIRSWVIWPGAILFWVSVIVLALARIAQSGIGVVLAPVFDVAVWTATISALFVAGGFFAAADILGWSYEDEKEYEQLEAEERETQAFRDKIAGEYQELSEKIARVKTNSKPQGDIPLSPSTKQPVVPRPGDGSFNLLSVVILLGLPLLGMACTETPGQPSSPPPAITPSPSSGSAGYELEIYGDTSMSPDSTALRAVYERLIPAQLIEIIEWWSVQKITTSVFNEDGWQARQTFSTDLPQPATPTPPSKASRGEASRVFPNLAHAIEVREAQQMALQVEQARRAYRDQVRQALNGLDATDLLPPPGTLEPDGTDVNGVLRRIAVPGPGRHLALLITDGEDTYGRGIEPIPKPSGDVRLVVVLVPGKRDRLAYQTFEARKAEISRAIPWAVVVPHYTADVEEHSRVFMEALAKTRALRTH